MKIERMNKGTWGKLRAFFDVQTDEGFTIKGFKIVEGINGLFVSPPSQKGKDDEYYDTVFIAPELREELNHTAIQHYGMVENEAPDNFNDFPASSSNTVADSESSTASDSSINSMGTSSDPEPSTDVKKEDEVSFSDDDIPF